MTRPSAEPPTSRPTGSDERGWWHGIAVIAAIGVALLLGAGLLAYQHVNTLWPWQTYPSQLHACGRDFEPAGDPETRAHVLHDDGAPGARLVRHGDVPGWFNDAEVYAEVFGTAAIDHLPGGCGAVMYVRGGRDAYKPYTLEGGV